MRDYEQRIRALENALSAQSQRMPRYTAKQRQLFDTGWSNETFISSGGYSGGTGLLSYVNIDCATTVGPQLDTGGICQVIDSRTVRFNVAGLYRIVARFKYRAVTPTAGQLLNAPALAKSGDSTTNAGQFFGAYGVNTYLIDARVRMAISGVTLLLPGSGGIVDSRFAAIAGGGSLSNDVETDHQFEAIAKVIRGSQITMTAASSKSSDYIAAGLQVEYLRASTEA